MIGAIYILLSMVCFGCANINYLFWADKKHAKHYYCAWMLSGAILLLMGSAI